MDVQNAVDGIKRSGRVVNPCAVSNFKLEGRFPAK